MLSYVWSAVDVVLVLKEERRRLDVVLLGGNVKRRKANLPSRIVLQKNGDDLVVTLLKGDGQRCKAILENTQNRIVGTQIFNVVRIGFVLTSSDFDYASGCLLLI